MCLQSFSVLLVISSFIPQVSSGEVRSPKTLKACYDNFAPMQMTPGAEDARIGILHELFREVFAADGYTVEFHGPYPYARVIQEVEEGECDTTPVTVLGVSKKALYPRTPIYMSKYVFFTRRDLKWTYQGTASLDAIDIATIASYDYSSMDPEYQSYLKGKKRNVTTIAGGNNGERILKMIAAKRLDMFCEDQYVGRYNLKKFGLEENVKISGGLKKELSLYPIFSPHHPHAKTLLEIWDRRIEKLKADGSIKRIYQKYGLTLE